MRLLWASCSLIIRGQLLRRRAALESPWTVTTTMMLCSASDRWCLLKTAHQKKKKKNQAFLQHLGDAPNKMLFSWLFGQKHLQAPGGRGAAGAGALWCRPTLWIIWKSLNKSASNERTAVNKWCGCEERKQETRWAKDVVEESCNLKTSRVTGLWSTCKNTTWTESDDFRLWLDLKRTTLPMQQHYVSCTEWLFSVTNIFRCFSIDFWDCVHYVFLSLHNLFKMG